MTFEKLLQLSKEIEQDLSKEFEEISHTIFENPELGLEEHFSSGYLAEYMTKKGFRVEYPYASFDTAFRAEFGTKGPKIAFLAEYDALPGYGEEQKNGHACGHNWIAAATAGAAVVLAKLTEHRDVQVVLIGTPAEETYCAKVAMVQDGVFDDIDVVMQPHLGEGTCICPHALAMNALTFEFRGRASHSAAAPWDGINALDAVQLMFMGINALRQHVRPDVRMHGIVKDGGQAANIVPDKATSLFYVRSATREYLNEVLEKVLNVARGAALMTGADLEIRYPELPMDNMVNLSTLQNLAEKHLGLHGILPEIYEEKAAEIAGSTDIGNVSHVCPTLYVEIGLDSPKPLMVHEESALDYVDSSYAYKRLHQTILTMVGVSLELVENPSLLEKAKEEFRKKTGKRVGNK